MCKNSAASKYAVSIVNPVTYVEHITSVESELSKIENLGKDDGQGRRRLQLNKQKRNWDVLGDGVYDPLHK